MTEEDLEEIHTAMGQLLEQDGAHVDRIYFDTSRASSPTEDRKPFPGMINKALKAFDSPPLQAAIVGDTLSDMRAAKNAGVKKRILVMTGHGHEEIVKDDLRSMTPPNVAADLLHAIEFLLDAADTATDDEEQNSLDTSRSSDASGASDNSASHE